MSRNVLPYHCKHAGRVMRRAINLRNHQTVSNSDNFTNLAGFYPDDIPFDLQLRIEPAKVQDGSVLKDGFLFLLFGVPNPDAQGFSKQSQCEIFRQVETCRLKWLQNIVLFKREVDWRIGGMGTECPFQEEWSFNESHLLENAAPRLAVAGAELFESVFESESDDGLKEVAGILRAATSAGGRYIRILSETFFLPWGMLYTHPIPGEKLNHDGSNWVKEGFWGYRHIIQHNPRKDRTDSKIASTGSMVPLSINLNERITSELILTERNRIFIDDHFDMIERLGGAPFIRRTTKSELRRSFCEERSVLERILYFYCHGHGSSTGETIELDTNKLILTDGPLDPVSAQDFQRWGNDAPLRTQPLIFINACQGGQMTTMFYQTLAFVLLKQGAAGVVGAQIDIPAVFAAAYARVVFNKFLSRSGERIRLGPLLRDINQIFWDKHNNPLGLVYSLYRGANCRVEWQPA